ncbi:hypothetical protein HK104_000994 [Borealophlyctis nickersoniae]|nr:hypothetical protein HK104_000994 [Borealophlyctis nickersoniae]
MKQRFSALDVSAQVAILRPSLVGLRLQNVYDINTRTYLWKFARPDHKELLLVESGIRMHTTQFARDKSNTPSAFCMKLRKHLRTRRLTAFDQLGADRVVDMRFGEGEHSYHVIVEFYASGNIILTDHEYRILALLRVVELEGTATPGKGAPVMPGTTEEEDTRFAVGETYNVTRAREFEAITEEKLRLALTVAVTGEGEAPNEGPGEELPDKGEEAHQAAAERAGDKKGGKGGKKKGDKNAKADKWGKTKKSQKESTLKKVVREKLGPDYGPALIEHCVMRSGLDPNMKIPGELDLTPGSGHVAALLQAFTEGDSIIRECLQKPQKGYIFVRNYRDGKLEEENNDTTANPSDRDGTPDKQPDLIAYHEFHPYPFSHFPASGAAAEPLEFPSFDKAVDEFFSKLEAQKLEIRARQAELSAAKKLESVKAGHTNQVKGLEMLQEQSIECARAIEGNLQGVDAVINTIRSFIASGMDWQELSELVRDEQKKGNPLAKMIVGLKLDIGMVTVGLRNPDIVESEDSDSESDEDEDEDTDEEGSRRRQIAAKKKEAAKKAEKDAGLLKVDLDIYSSAFANARRYYDHKKLAAVKHEKTLQAAEKALKSAERKIAQDLKTTQQNTAVIKKMRKPFWFEKFLWFISSENYLVVGGRDAGQNEVLVRRYLKKGDVYVHADLHGAASVIVKNLNTPTATEQDTAGAAPVIAPPPPGPDGCTIPPTTLHQAGTMSVCQSRAWDAKIVTSAWWVFDHQVSKTAPTGEYLTTGSFMIRGKKNWLPPVQLVYGFGILFRVDEASVGRHYWERRPWGRHRDEAEEPADVERGIPGGAGVPRVDSSMSLASSSGVDGGSLSNLADVEDADGSDAGSDSGSSPGDGEGEDEQAAVQTEEEEAAHSQADALEEAAEEKVGGEQNSGDNADEDEDFEFPDTQVEMPSLSATAAIDKYSFAGDAAGENEAAENADSSGTKESSRGGRRLTAKERRELKKKRKGGAAGTGEDVEDVGSGDEDANGKAKPNAKGPATEGLQKQQRQEQQEQQQPNTNVRGKKGKMKKLKDKYAEQDDEDRELMLELLGSAKGPQPKGKKAKAEAAKKEAAAAKKKAAEQAGKKSQQQQQQQHGAKGGAGAGKRSATAPPVDGSGILQFSADPATDADANAGAASASLARRGSTDDAEVRRLLEEENVALPDEDQAANMSFLDSLTGEPHPSDILLHAVPVCAPWTALQRYKYKVKSVPGALKKGKAAKSAISWFLAIAAAEEVVARKGGSMGGGGGDVEKERETERERAEAAGREKELIKSVPEMEVIGAMLAKVKLVTTGAEGKKKGSGGGGGKKGGGKKGK